MTIEGQDNKAEEEGRQGRKKAGEGGQVWRRGWSEEIENETE